MANAITRNLRMIRPRSINAGAASAPVAKEKQAAATHCAYIFKHPQFNIIKGAFQEGVRPTEIAAWFAKEGWLDTVNEKTFYAYLITFRKNYPEICSGNSDQKSIDALVSANQPDIDIEKEISRLIRLQKIRLKSVVDFELTTPGMLQGSAEKAVENTGKLLELAAKVKMKGHFGQAGAGSSIDTSPEVNDVIRNLKSDETARDRMYHLTNSLVGAIEKHGNVVAGKAKARS